MRVVPITASDKQLSRLRNGHRVRIKKAVEGCGVNLLVDPSKFDPISRSFAKGSAYEIQLSPDELMANKTAASTGEIEGQGIYKKCKGGKIKMPSMKKVGKTLSKAGKETLKGLATAEEAVRKNPVGRLLVKELVPLAAEAAVTGLATYAGADPGTAKTLGKVGSKASKAGLSEAGYGLYAGSSRGYGLYAGMGACGGALLGPPSRLPEKSSISVGGTLLGRQSNLPPAMQSQPMSANFHFNTQLPPQFQRGGIRFN